MKTSDKSAKRNTIKGSVVSESLLFGDLEITKMEESGDFMIILKQYDGDVLNYLTAENAKQIITFLQKQLNSH